MGGFTGHLYAARNEVVVIREVRPCQKAVEVWSRVRITTPTTILGQDVLEEGGEV